MDWRNKGRAPLCWAVGFVAVDVSSPLLDVRRVPAPRAAANPPPSGSSSSAGGMQDPADIRNLPIDIAFSRLGGEGLRTWPVIFCCIIPTVSFDRFLLLFLNVDSFLVLDLLKNGWWIGGGSRPTGGSASGQSDHGSPPRLHPFLGIWIPSSKHWILKVVWCPNSVIVSDFDYFTTTVNGNCDARMSFSFLFHDIRRIHQFRVQGNPFSWECLRLYFQFFGFSVLILFGRTFRGPVGVTECSGEPRKSASICICSTNMYYESRQACAFIRWVCTMKVCKHVQSVVFKNKRSNFTSLHIAFFNTKKCNDIMSSKFYVHDDKVMGIPGGLGFPQYTVLLITCRHSWIHSCAQFWTAVSDSSMDVIMFLISRIET